MFARISHLTVRDAVLEVDLPERPELVILPAKSLGREGGLHWGYVLLQGEDGARLVARVEEIGGGMPTVYARQGELLKVFCRRQMQADGGLALSVMSAVAADRSEIDAIYLGAALQKARRASVPQSREDLFVMSLPSGDYVVKKTTTTEITDLSLSPWSYDDVPDLSDWDDVDNWSDWGDEEPVAADGDGLLDVEALLDVLGQDEEMPLDSTSDTVQEEDMQVGNPAIEMISSIVDGLFDGAVVGAVVGVHGFEEAVADTARGRMIELCNLIDGMEADEDDFLYVETHQSDSRTGAVTRSMAAQEAVWMVEDS